MERTPYKQRVNLRSGSARSSLETALNKQFKSAGVNWTIAISKAWDAAETAFRAGRKPVALDEDEDDMETFLIPELLPEGVPTILFGDGSAGKSYIAGGMVAAVSIGDYFAGYPAQQRNVLYCDWETNVKTWKRRMRRVYRGMNIDPAIGEGLPIRYWNAVGQPLVECIDQIRAIVREHDIGLVVIDSGGFACGGPPEETQPAIDFFNALSRIQTTTLILCHVSKEALNKSTPPDRPFGSQYWHNGARRTWYVARASEPGSDEVDIGLYCKKVNDGPLPKGVGLDMVFEGRNGPVQFFSKDIALTAYATMHQSDRERVLEYLNTSPMTKRATKDIAEALGMTPRNCYQLLQRFPDTFVGLTNAPAGRPDQQWGIRARESA